MTEELLNTQQVTEYLGIDLRTLYRFIQERKIPAIRVGKQWRFRRSDLDAWLDQQQVNPQAGPLRVLVVDDEELVREVMTKILTGAGYEVVQSANGEEALEQLKTSFFHAIFVDLRMPGMGGMEFIARAREESPDTGIVIITGYASMESAIEAIELGVDGYLLKPLNNVDEVLEAAERAVHAPRKPVPRR